MGHIGDHGVILGCGAGARATSTMSDASRNSKARVRTCCCAGEVCDHLYKSWVLPLRRCELSPHGTQTSTHVRKGAQRDGRATAVRLGGLLRRCVPHAKEGANSPIGASPELGEPSVRPIVVESLLCLVGPCPLSDQGFGQRVVRWTLRGTVGIEEIEAWQEVCPDPLRGGLHPAIPARSDVDKRCVVRCLLCLRGAAVVCRVPRCTSPDGARLLPNTELARGNRPP